MVSIVFFIINIVIDIIIVVMMIFFSRVKCIAPIQISDWNQVD